MNLKNASILPRQQVLQLVEEARNAELCRDVEQMRQIVESFWDDFDRAPDLSGYEKPLRAEIVRIAGAFFSFYGFARNKRDYQTRGKDLLTEAIAAFESENLTDQAAEAKVLLAHCYWNTGEVEESEALLEMVEREFGARPAHPLYLRMRINLLSTLIWKKDFDRVREVIESISAHIAAGGEPRLEVKFHTDAGIFYRSMKEYERAVFHYTEAIRKAEEIGNKTSVAFVLNNLAFLYKETGQFAQAVLHVNAAIKRAEETGIRGWLPHLLDTKALVFLDSGHPDAAFQTISEAIEIFREGEDAAGLCDALWTAVRCLLRLDRKEEALIRFGELLETARSRIGASAEQKFASALAGEIYALNNLPYADEVHRFKKDRVRAALVQANGKIIEAARLLGLRSHQALSDMLSTQFPELYGEMNLSRRSRRGAGKKEKVVTVLASRILEERPVSRLVLPKGKKYAFDFDFDSSTVELFYFNQKLMRWHGIETDAIVAAAPVARLRAGQTILISEGKRFIVERVQYDSFARVFFVLDERGEPVIVGENDPILEPVGYCPFERSEWNLIIFSELKTDEK